jgi:hypothetical protein
MNRHGQDDGADFTIDLVPLSDITWRINVSWPDARSVTVGFLVVQQGQFQMLWTEVGEDETAVLFESPEAAAGGVARRVLEATRSGIRP